MIVPVLIHVLKIAGQCALTTAGVWLGVRSMDSIHNALKERRAKKDAEKSLKDAVEVKVVETPVTEGDVK